MKPLEGITVLDMSQFVAAPTCGRILAEWGANVIKIETAKGDPSRLNGTMAKIPILGDDENPCFDSNNLCKKFISIDLKNPQGHAVLERMMDTADVLLMSIRPASAKRLGLDWESVHARWPRIVYASSIGFGEEGPMKDVAGYDYTAFGARGGLIGSMGQLGEAPANFIPAFGDYTTAIAMALGTVTALFGRERSGEGDKVTASLYNAAMYVMGYAVMGVEGGMEYPFSRKDAPTPTANSYPCSDGRWIQFCATPYNNFYNKIMKIIGREDLVDSPLYCDHVTLQKTNRCAELVSIIEEKMVCRTSDEWIEAFREADIPCEKIASFQELVADEQSWASHALRKVRYPSGNTHTLISIPVKLNSAGWPEYEGNTARRIGYHTKEVLAGYGYSDEEIRALAETNAIVI